MIVRFTMGSILSIIPKILIEFTETPGLVLVHMHRLLGIKGFKRFFKVRINMNFKKWSKKKSFPRHVNFLTSQQAAYKQNVPLLVSLTCQYLLLYFRSMRFGTFQHISETFLSLFSHQCKIGKFGNFVCKLRKKSSTASLGDLKQSFMLIYFDDFTSLNLTSGAGAPLGVVLSPLQLVI